MVDGFGKESINPDLEPYQYKNEVAIPILGMVDDILMVSEPGHKAVRMNAFINSKTAFKRLQFGPEKCFKLNIGNILEHKNIDLYVDGWKIEEVQHLETGETYSSETFNGEQEIFEKSHEHYLGK